MSDGMKLDINADAVSSDILNLLIDLVAETKVNNVLVIQMLIKQINPNISDEEMFNKSNALFKEMEEKTRVERLNIIAQLTSLG